MQTRMNSNVKPEMNLLIEEYIEEQIEGHEPLDQYEQLLDEEYHKTLARKGVEVDTLKDVRGINPTYIERGEDILAELQEQIEEAREQANGFSQRVHDLEWRQHRVVMALRRHKRDLHDFHFDC